MSQVKPLLSVSAAPFQVLLMHDMTRQVLKVDEVKFQALQCNAALPALTRGNWVSLSWQQTCLTTSDSVLRLLAIHHPPLLAPLTPSRPQGQPLAQLACRLPRHDRQVAVQTSCAICQNTASPISIARCSCGFLWLVLHRGKGKGGRGAP